MPHRNTVKGFLYDSCLKPTYFPREIWSQSPYKMLYYQVSEHCHDLPFPGILYSGTLYSVSSPGSLYYVLNALNMLPLSVFSYLIPELVAWTIKTNHDEEQVLGHPSGLNLFLANVVLTSESRPKRTNIGGLPRHKECAQVKLMAIYLTQNQGVV